MAEKLKTTVCVLILALSLLAAYAQEATWTGETAPACEPVPSAVMGCVWN